MASKHQPTSTSNIHKIEAWEEPPAEAFTSHPYAVVVDELKAHPDQWARLDDRFSENAAQQFVSNVRRGKIKGFAEGEFDARHHGPSVWVRYLGERDLDLRGYRR